MQAGYSGTRGWAKGTQVPIVCLGTCTGEGKKVPQARIERATLALGVLCSVLLSYWGPRRIISRFGLGLLRCSLCPRHGRCMPLQVSPYTSIDILLDECQYDEHSLTV